VEVKLIPSILIGISGDSGVGKTTITSMIQEVIITINGKEATLNGRILLI